MDEGLQQPHTQHVWLHICNRSGPHVPIMNVFLCKAAGLCELKMCTAGACEAGFPAVSSHSTLSQGSCLKAFGMETECSIRSERGSRELEQTASKQKCQPRNEKSPKGKEEVFPLCPGSQLLEDGNCSPLVEVMPHVAFQAPSVVWELDSI